MTAVKLRNILWKLLGKEGRPPRKWSNSNPYSGMQLLQFGTNVNDLPTLETWLQENGFSKAKWGWKNDAGNIVKMWSDDSTFFLNVTVIGPKKKKRRTLPYYD